MQTAEVGLDDTLEKLSHHIGGPLLSVDTSTSIASLAFIDATKSPAVRSVSLPARALPSEGLFQAIVTLVEDAGYQAKDLRTLTVGLGPGSFTGLRVGLASVKGIALSTGVDVYGFNSSLAVAESLGSGRTWVIGDARRQSVHVMGVDVSANAQTRIVADVACLSYADAKARIEREGRSSFEAVRLVGDGVSLVYPDDTWPAWAAKVDAEVSAAWGVFSLRDKIGRGDKDDVATLAPLYLQIMPVPEASRRQPI